MRDVMIDLETLGRSAGCTILSIGAVAFDAQANDVGDAVSYIVSRPSCRHFGLHEDQETLDFWAAQDPDVAQILELADDDAIAIPLDLALGDLSGWLEQFGPEVRIWGNGSDFDNAILAAAYRAVGRATPWQFWNNRCYRTLKNLSPEIELQRIGSAHNAIDDAFSQAFHAIDLLRHQRDLRSRVSPPLEMILVLASLLALVVALVVDGL